MKYIKIFDSTQGTQSIFGEYWKIKLKSKTYLKIASQKIDSELSDIDINFIFNNLKMYKKYKYVYLVRYISDNGLTWWRYEFDSSAFNKNIYYMGEIKIPDYEVDAYLYNL